MVEEISRYYPISSYFKASVSTMSLKCSIPLALLSGGCQ